MVVVVGETGETEVAVAVGYCIGLSVAGHPAAAAVCLRQVASHCMHSTMSCAACLLLLAGLLSAMDLVLIRQTVVVHKAVPVETAATVQAAKS